VSACILRKVFWRRRTCLERFLLVLSGCLVVAVIVLLSLIASSQSPAPSQPHDAQPRQQSTATGCSCHQLWYSLQRHSQYGRTTYGFLRAKAAMLSARLSHRNSVCLSVTRVDQAKTVQARITKFSPSAAWKTLVSGTVKLFHKFEGGHSERGP